MGVLGLFRARYARILFQRTPLLEQLPTPLFCATNFVDYSVKYRPGINKSRPRLVAALKQG